MSNELVTLQSTESSIPVDSEGRFNLTWIWTQEGRPNGKSPGEWKKSLKTESFINYISEIERRDKSLLITTVKRNSKSWSIWAHWQIALAYGQWISDECQRRVQDGYRQWCDAKKERQVEQPKTKIQILAQTTSALAVVVQEMARLEEQQIEESRRRAELAVQVAANAEKVEKAIEQVKETAEKALELVGPDTRGYPIVVWASSMQKCPIPKSQIEQWASKEGGYCGRIARANGIDTTQLEMQHNNGRFAGKRWPLAAIALWWPDCCKRHGWTVTWYGWPNDLKHMLPQI